MNFHPMTYQLFGNKFVTREMKLVFAEINYLQKILDVEAALAEAEGELGLIPARVVPLIKEQARAEKIDLGQVQEVQKKAGHYLVSVLKVLEKNVPGESGQYIHFGGTAQEIIDTAMVLLIREALVLIKRDLTAILKGALDLAERYQKTPMAGRTHGVHAVPITFGFKAAVWAAEVARHLKRLEELEPRLLVGNLTGAAGRVGRFWPRGKEVQDRGKARAGLFHPP